MSRHAPDPILSAAELEKLRTAINAGEYDHLKAPVPERLNPESDPFGVNFEWLDEPDAATPAERVYGTLGVRSESRWYLTVGSELRRIALEDRLASGSDEEIIRAWAVAEFPRICQLAGAEADSLLGQIRSARYPTRETTMAVHAILESVPEFAGMTLDQRVAAALIIVRIHNRK
jgi:hypothetical protein